jgi:hypothetical protein
MDDINTKLDLIIVKLNKIERHIELTSSTCDRMDDHIDFVEDTYNKLRHPIQYITGQTLASRDDGKLTIL